MSNGGVEPNRNGGKPPKDAPPGRCLGCMTLVPHEALLPHSDGSHRHFDAQKRACGPVHTQWEYHVAFWYRLGDHEGFKDGQMVTRTPIETAQHIGSLKGVVAQTFKVMDDLSGAQLIGQALKPELAVISWQLLRSW